MQNKHKKIVIMLLLALLQTSSLLAQNAFVLYNPKYMHEYGQYLDSKSYLTDYLFSKYYLQNHYEPFEADKLDRIMIKRGYGLNVKPEYNDVLPTSLRAW